MKFVEVVHWNLFSLQNIAAPPSLSEDGNMYHGSKSDLIDELVATTPGCLSDELPLCDAVVVDGPAVVHMLSPKNGSTVEEYCELYLGCVRKFFNLHEKVILDTILDTISGVI